MSAGWTESRMERQTDMEKNRIMEAFLSLGLLVLAVLCVAVPFFVLFTGDGTYSWQFGDPATKKMMAEIALLFVLLSGILLLGKRPAVRWGKTALVCLIFCWGHVIFLPMTVSVLYLGYVILAGRFVRTVLLGQKEIEDGWMADFILGVSAVLCAFCLLSAFKTGSIAQRQRSKRRFPERRISKRRTSKSRISKRRISGKKQNALGASDCLYHCDDSGTGRAHEYFPGF